MPTPLEFEVTTILDRTWRNGSLSVSGPNLDLAERVIPPQPGARICERHGDLWSNASGSARKASNTAQILRVNLTSHAAMR